MSYDERREKPVYQAFQAPVDVYSGPDFVDWVLSNSNPSMVQFPTSTGIVGNGILKLR